MDLENGKGFDQKKCMIFKDIIGAMGLSDVFRSKHPASSEFTFFRPGCTSSRLDRVYLSSNLISTVTQICHLASLSDHMAVKMSLRVDLGFVPPKSSFKRTTYWKLNAAILHEEEFIESFTCFWQSILRSTKVYDNIAEWWDKHAKPQIKSFCIVYSSIRSKKRRHTKKFLLSRLKNALENNNWSEIVRLTEEINCMIKFDAYGFVVRSRYQRDKYLLSSVDSKLNFCCHQY